MTRRLFVASVLALLVLSACGGAATESAPAADQTTTEQAPAENTDTQAAESSEGGDVAPAPDANAPTSVSGPFLGMLSDAQVQTVNPADKSAFPQTDTQVLYLSDMDLASAKTDLNAQYTAAGFTVTESTEKPGVESLVAKAPAGSAWAGICAVTLMKAPDAAAAAQMGTDKLAVTIMCVKQ